VSRRRIDKNAMHYLPAVRHSKQDSRIEPASQPAVSRMKSMLLGVRGKKEVYEVIWLVPSGTSQHPAQTLACRRDGHVKSVIATEILEGFMSRWWCSRSDETALSGAFIRISGFIVNEFAHVMPAVGISLKKPDNLTEEFARGWRLRHQPCEVAIRRAETHIIPGWHVWLGVAARRGHDQSW
jgi:hypothetical protein